MSVSYFIPDLAPEDLHRCEEIVRRSRFIVSLAHTPTPEAAKSFIERIKQEFPDATHNCWAYAAGAPGQTSKNRTARRAAPCSPCCCTAGSVSFPRS